MVVWKLSDTIPGLNWKELIFIAILIAMILNVPSSLKVVHVENWRQRLEQQQQLTGI